MIPLKSLHDLPLPLLAAMAESLARDIDAGEDKSAMLERVFQAIYTQPKKRLVLT